MKKYGAGLLIGVLVACCSVNGANFFEAQRKKLIDIIDDAGKQAHNVTCKIRDSISPQSKKKDTTFAEAKILLESIQKELKSVRVVVIDALEKNSFNQPRLTASLKELTADTEKLALLEKLDQDSRATLKELSDTILLTYQALLEEAGVLDLWVQGYEAYQRDLEDNFKNLPNALLQKPDFKKLYEEIGMSTTEGIKAGITTVQNNYKARFDALQAQHGANFESMCFKPYLRVLQYVFRTPYSKQQYDAFLAGKEAYNAKGKALQAHKQAIQKLFVQDLPMLRIITGTLQAEIC